MKKIIITLIALHFGIEIGYGATVGMDGFNQFLPNSLTVRVGEEIEFINHSNRKHTVTADPNLAQDPTHVVLPQGAEPFHSGVILPGQSFRHVFTVPGEYQYICLPHEMMGMSGRILVEAN